eukprot:TRINITY_DN73144_c0_g1_i1.p1 TRINITY_DN73144_c0_g1~~TRINITY_DN73144_c0_g1_i1.p1  ORF type:complete len:110 (-),score=4.03 TRINITY_DN73144_c0_g1_i1:159-488(-)
MLVAKSASRVNHSPQNKSDVTRVPLSILENIFYCISNTENRFHNRTNHLGPQPVRIKRQSNRVAYSLTDLLGHGLLFEFGENLASGFLELLRHCPHKMFRRDLVIECVN